VDLSKFRTSDWLIIAGGAAMLIFGLALDWATYHSVSGNNAFDYFFTGGIAWILLVAAAVVTFLLAGGLMKRGTLPWPLIVLGATALATLLMLIRLILGGGSEGAGGFSVDLDRGAGMYVAFICSVVALAGAVLGFKESGGELSDLTDMNKLKSAFGAGGRAGEVPPPPPPPPPPAPPPPPPPAP